MLGSLLNPSAGSLPTFMKNSRLRLCMFRGGVQDCVCVCVKSLSHVQLCATLWTVACQALLSMGFSRHGVAMPSSRGSSWPRDRTCLLCLLHWEAGSLPLAPLEKHGIKDYVAAFLVIEPFVLLPSAHLFLFSFSTYWIVISSLPLFFLWIKFHWHITLSAI